MIPDQDQLNRAFGLMCKQSANVQYFFFKLDDPDWLFVLKDRDLFRHPPSMIPDLHGNLRISGNWPQADYLKRMAKKGDYTVQKQVLEIMLEVGKTNNYFIHRDFAETALAMPTDLAVKWAKHEAKWLRDGNNMFRYLEDRLGQLASKLAKEGQSDVALKLAAELLSVFPDPEADKKAHPKDEAEKIAYSSLQPQIRTDQYNYEQILKQNIPDMVNSAPFETLGLLCKLLDKFILCSQREGDKHKPYDFTSVTRPAIEDHEQNNNNDHTIDGSLITAVRDTAEKICKEQPAKTQEMVEKVESFGWNIFRRIGLHLLRVVENPPIDMVEKRLLNEELFNYVGTHHEYFHLTKKYFGKLSAESKTRILRWIDETKKEKEYQEEHDSELTSEKKERQIKYWQYRKLIPIQEYLTGEWKARFDALKQELKEPEIPPDFHSYMSSMWEGPQSPKKHEDLAQMSMNERIEYLKTWKPSGEWMAPTPDGLGGVLGALVAENPEIYATEIERFMDKDIDPTYIRHTISGFCQALEKGKVLPYALLFKLCKWIVDQPAKIPGRVVPKQLRDGIEMDADWRSTRREIARLFEKVFDDKMKLPFELRDEAWVIIKPLADDSEPSLEYETKYGGNNMDPLTLSINTVRGKALHGVIDYALWVCRNIKDDIQKREQRPPSFRDMPEVANVLKTHLDLENDKSQTSRAVFGQWLPQLVNIDKEWVKSNLAQIFPHEPDFKQLRDATWNTYLMYSGLYNSVFEVIQNIYEEEVKSLAGKTIKEDSYKTPEIRLSEHVVVLYAREKIDLNEGGLIDTIFRSASDELKYHMMDFIGRSLQGEKDLKKNVVALFKQLWEWRIQMVGGIEKMPLKELSAFGWWFASGKFENSWAFAYLEKVLQRVGISRSNLYVFEYMSKVFPAYPKESLRCLLLFIDKNDDPWFFFGTHKQKKVWSILEQAMNSLDDNSHSKAEEIIHLLGSKGYLDYRKLLKKSERQGPANSK